MAHRNTNKVSAAEVFGSIKFPGKQSVAPARPWPSRSFAVNKSVHVGEALLDDYKLVRSSN
jgi:hypothetical protein